MMCRTIPPLLVSSPTPLHVDHTVEQKKALIPDTPHDTAVAGQRIVGTAEADIPLTPFHLQAISPMPKLKRQAKIRPFKVS